MEVELIIRAHDCHTVCCNMEGISNVLRKCRECSDALAMAEELALLVRLRDSWSLPRGLFSRGQYLGVAGLR